MFTSKRFLALAAIAAAAGLHTGAQAQEITYLGYTYVGTAFGCAFAPKPFNGKGSNWYPQSVSAAYKAGNKTVAAAIAYTEFSNDRSRRYRWQAWAFPAEAILTITWVWRSDKNEVRVNSGDLMVPAHYAKSGFEAPAGCWEGSSPNPYAKSPSKAPGQPQPSGPAVPAPPAPAVAPQLPPAPVRSTGPKPVPPAPSTSARPVPAAPASGGVSRSPASGGPARL